MSASVRQSVRRRVSALLEQRASIKRHLGWLAAPWAWTADPVRPLRLPRGVHCVGVAGATLGGSGATPVALELCEALAARGASVAYVAHGYTTGLRRRVLHAAPRRALPGSEVCDEARLAARRLEPLGVPVFVAGRRQLALDRAASWLPRGGIAILDGALQARPQPLSESVLVVDAEYPWGSGFCPPVGDLVAARSRLLRADCIIALHRGGVPHGDLPPRALQVPRTLTGVYSAHTAERRSLDWLASQDVQLALAVARPERVVEQLGRHGLHARRVLEAADHGGLAALLTPKKSSNGECWVCTEKCWAATLALHPQPARAFASRVWILEERLELPRAWLDSLLERLAEPSRPSRASDPFDDSQRTGQDC